MKLTPLPDDFSTTRDALHQVAFFAVAPARYRAEGRMGLRPAPGGFGTPEFDGSIARVEGDMLVFEKQGVIATQSVSTVREAARFFGHEYEVDWFPDFHDPLDPVDPDRRLHVDDVVARALGQWFHFGFSVLAELRHLGGPDSRPSEVQLWPEHFDPATELGDEAAGSRASYGASPGDSDHAEPYVYVAPWGEIDRNRRYWDDDSFGGASLAYSALLASDDPMERALDFLYEGYRHLVEAD
jgi:hypothetical protein